MVVHTGMIYNWRCSLLNYEINWIFKSRANVIVSNSRRCFVVNCLKNDCRFTSFFTFSDKCFPFFLFRSLNNNKISTIEKGSLDNLTSLEWLKLNKNKLQHLPKKVFFNLKTLKTLWVFKLIKHRGVERCKNKMHRTFPWISAVLFHWWIAAWKGILHYTLMIDINSAPVSLKEGISFQRTMVQKNFIC